MNVQMRNDGMIVIVLGALAAIFCFFVWVFGAFDSTWFSAVFTDMYFWVISLGVPTLFTAGVFIFMELFTDTDDTSSFGGMARYSFSTYSRYHRRSSYNRLTVCEGLTIIVVAMVSNFFIFNAFRDAAMYRTEQIGGVIVQKLVVPALNLPPESHYHSECVEYNHDKDGNTTSCKTERHWYTYSRDYFLLNDSAGAINPATNAPDEPWWDGWKQNTGRVELGSADANFIPPIEFQQAQIGDYVSYDHQYKNYVAASHTEENDIIRQTFPNLGCGNAPYSKISNKQFDGIVTVGFGSDYLKSWNITPQEERVRDITQLNKTFNEWKPKEHIIPSVLPPMYLDAIFGQWGPHIQAFPVLIFINGDDSMADACLQGYWEGGPKNSVYVFFIGTASNNTFVVDHTRVEYGTTAEGQSPNFNLKFSLETDLNEYFSKGGQMDRVTVLSMIYNKVSPQFNRYEMRNFEGLKQGVHPPKWAMWMMVVLIIIYTIIMLYVFIQYIDWEI